MRIAVLFLLGLCAPQDPVPSTAVVTLAPHDRDRRWILAEAPVPFAGPYSVVDERGHSVKAQGDSDRVRFLVPFLAAGGRARFTVSPGTTRGTEVDVTQPEPGVYSVLIDDREITRYHVGAWARKHRKPFFYPLRVNGVNVLRGHPMEPQPDEPTDHRHHTGMWFAFGEVNGKDYWIENPIVPGVKHIESGPAYARLLTENTWGEDLKETRDVRILNSGENVVIDWDITLTAANGPVVFARDLKLAKEGAFGLRVAASLSAATGDAPQTISDAEGRKGEKEVRAGAAPWVHYSGEVGGKPIGIAVMNHPTSFRYPGDWHVRAYGLFAANPWILKGENTLQKGESLRLRWRVYLHGGAIGDGKAADVFAGYANAVAE